MGERYVICVDDEVIITESLRRELRNELPRLRIGAAYSGEAALRLLEEIRLDGGEPAVLVTDERMPGIQGHMLLREARRIYPRMYGILLTGFSDVEAIAHAVNEAGLFRYIRKPWDRRDLVMAVSRAAELFERESELELLRRKVQELNEALIAALERPPPATDPDSFRHVHRVARYAALLGRRLGLAESEVRKLFVYAPLHDIGKAGIPHEIMGKPRALSPEEFEVVKRHVESGVELLRSIQIDPLAKDLILYHHERWDGKGYLAEFSGDRIPLSAWITAVADAFDAMLTRRPYKEAFPFDAAALEIEAEAGTRFDPEVVEAFRAERENLRDLCCSEDAGERLGLQGIL